MHHTLVDFFSVVSKSSKPPAKLIIIKFKSYMYLSQDETCTARSVHTTQPDEFQRLWNVQGVTGAKLPLCHTLHTNTK